MAIYGRGLNREVVAAVNQGLIAEPFSVEQVRLYAHDRGWDVPETYLTVCLANGASPAHSPTYEKYFVALGDGRYRLSNNYRGVVWE